MAAGVFSVSGLRRERVVQDAEAAHRASRLTLALLIPVALLLVIGL